MSRRVFFHRRPDALAEQATDPLVWLDPYRGPRSPFERAVFAELAGGPLASERLVERLAAAAVIAASTRGVWPLEVGADALSIFRDEARRRLADLDGGLIAIATPLPVRVAAVGSWQLLLCA